MSTLILCLFIACLFPYLCKIPVAIAMGRQKEGYDNAHPRAQQAKLTGFGARALAAHQNSFESLLIYACAILTALATHHTDSTIRNLAILYLVVRIIYYIAYFKNWASFRSIIWAVGLLASLGILWLCIP